MKTWVVFVLTVLWAAALLPAVQQLLDRVKARLDGPQPPVARPRRHVVARRVPPYDWSNDPQVGAP